MPLDRRHILKQSAALLRLGISEIDIERTSSWVEKHLPEGADANTWIPTTAELSDTLMDEAAVADARAAWWQDRSVPRRYRKLLDAGGI